jgi:lipopolysaccharide transport system permease protein
MGMRLNSLGAGLEKYSYSIYLITGLLAWNCFAATLTRVTQVFHEKASLIGKVRLSLWTLPLYVVFSETILYLISMLFFIIFLLIIGFKFSFTWFWWPIIFVCQQLLAYALGLISAVLSVFIRDIKEIIGIFIQLWFWMTPIAYVVTIIPEDYKIVFAFNPLYHLVEAYRSAMIYGQTPDLIFLSLLLLVSLALLCGTVFLGRKLERDIRDFL